MENYEKMVTDAINTIQSFISNMEEYKEGTFSVQYGNDDRYGDYILFDSHEQQEKIEQFIIENIDETSGPESYFDLVGFLDEYTFCSSCGSLLHLTDYNNPNDFLISEGEITCNNCLVKRGLGVFIDDFINNPRKAIPYNMFKTSDLTDLGFELLESNKENSLYSLSSDSPSNDLERLQFEYDDIVFYINSSNPFETVYSVYGRTKEKYKYKGVTRKVLRLQPEIEHIMSNDNWAVEEYKTHYNDDKLVIMVTIEKHEKVFAVIHQNAFDSWLDNWSDEEIDRRSNC